MLSHADSRIEYEQRGLPSESKSSGYEIRIEDRRNGVGAGDLELLELGL